MSTKRNALAGLKVESADFKLPQIKVETTEEKKPQIKQEQHQPEPPKETAKKLNIPMQQSDISKLATIEQKKHKPTAEVKTENGKDGVDEQHSFMRSGYWINEKTLETWIPLSERKKLFKMMFPLGAILARQSQVSFKSATAECRLMRNAQDSNPFVEESGAANRADVPYHLRKKVPQVAVSNATYRALNNASIPMTLSELYKILLNGETTEEEILSTLKHDDIKFQEGWNYLKEKQEASTSDWKDVDELEEELEETALEIQIGDISVKQEDLLKTIEQELNIENNEALFQGLARIIKNYVETNIKPQEVAKTVQKETIKQDKEVIDNKETKKPTPTKKYFVARDKMTGHKIKSFASRKEAAEWANIAPNSISAALSPATRNKTAGGYHWTKEEK